MAIKKHECACKREFAANALTQALPRFEEGEILGEGGYGIVCHVVCTQTKKEYAVKTIRPVSCNGRQETWAFQCLMALSLFMIMLVAS